MIVSPGCLMHAPTIVTLKITLFAAVCATILFSFTAPYLSSGNVSDPIPNWHLRPTQEERPSLPILKSYGASHCLSDVTDELVAESRAWNASCGKFAPHAPTRSRIGRVLLQYGEMKEYIKRALKTHVVHSMIHQTDLHILCDAMAEEWDLWNKPAFILRMLLEQMTLPPDDRVEWLLWMDLDTLILDQCRPMSSFLPPENVEELVHTAEAARRLAKREDEKDTVGHDDSSPSPINLITTKDASGLNNGIFLLRVSPWAVELFENILAYRFYNPNITLIFNDQSAMEFILATPKFASNVVYTPWHWFNAYPNSEAGPERFRDRENGDTEELKEFQVRRGDSLVHFAGPWFKDEPMTAWEDVVEGMGNVWEEGRVQRDISKEVKKFWEEKGFN
ncbi:glycosyltransferase family 34 protein [Lentithecium fluviatile CBS 122367]|uniref:Glycosyltransferase family 34 protein n=1 Tax=Lentithecium fluviatile CBS 122367 TaxID=1168545 RepID=A0A6G1IXB2_9PLEO|nr:glycosyltransferase family 34 protein [Lentithecium fluviatile CBS 122367]